MPITFIDASGQRFDPLRGYKFIVTSQPTGDPPLKCGFNKVSGLSEESEVAEYRDGCDPVTMRKFPGLVTFEDIVLERGLSMEESLLAWREEVIRSRGISSGSGGEGIRGTGANATDGRFSLFRRTLIIQLYDRGSSAIAREWRCIDAWPKKLDDGELDASSSDVVIESAEICHEGLVRSKVATAAALRSSGT